MAQDDFNPVEGTVTLPTVTGNRKAITVFPPDGAHVAAGVIVATANKPAILALLDQIAALADESTFKIWTAGSLPGKRARVKVIGRVFRDAPLAP